MQPMKNRNNAEPQTSAHTPSSSADDHKSYFAYTLKPIPVFIALTVVRILAALYSPIADCDETYNYWEPMHYLLYGFGFQTWEYSPEYALRSYAYLYPYALIAKLAAVVYQLLYHTFGFPLISSPKIFVFYAVRVCLAVITSFSETLLFRAVGHRFGKFVAMLLFIFLVTSPGMFRSSVEFLPSTFSMVLLTVSLGAWMQERLFLAVFCVGVASLMGWVFSAILAVPLAVDILFRTNGIKQFIIYAAVSGVAMIAIMVPIDTYYFGVPTFAPLNHILYNVFPKEGAGSHIFGEESWTFYAKNLLLNCNLPALVYVSFPVVFLLGVLFRLPEYRDAGMKDRLRFLSGSYLAIAIFVLQPHKEERFLAPCYPCIALVAAVGFNDLLRMLGMLGMLTSLVSRKIALLLFPFVCILVLAVNALLGFSRIFMQVKSFHAPLSIYQQLSINELRNGIGPGNSPPEFLDNDTEVNICIGSEWYRFPTSFFLPHKRFRARFVFSGFDGLLPKPFQDSENGTRIIPSGMNEFNKADPDQFFNWVDGKGCHYFVNLELSHPGDESSLGQSSLPIPQEARYVAYRNRFLNSNKSSAGLRAFYLPGFEHKLVHGEYQVVRNMNLLPFGYQYSEPLDIP